MVINYNKPYILVCIDETENIIMAAKLLETPETPRKDEEPETLTRLDGTEPERRDVASDTLSSRVVIVSPYSQLNVFFETEIQRVIPESETDIISRADLLEYPYIEVDAREKDLTRPFWVIDFGGLIAKSPSEIYIRNELIKRIKEATREKIEEIIEGIPHHHFLDPSSGDLMERIYFGLKLPFEVELTDVLNEARTQITKEAPLVYKVVNFEGYQTWVRGKGIKYVTPSDEFRLNLERKHSFDENGNFAPAGVFIDLYVDGLRNDLRSIAEGKLFASLLRVDEH